MNPSLAGLPPLTFDLALRGRGGLHGLSDGVVPVTNGKALYASLTKAQKAYQSATKSGQEHYKSVAYPPLWIPDVGHNDMPEFECMQNIAKFLTFLETRK